MKITCVGGGPAGLYFAILAARQGHDVTVLERLPESEIYGWGVVFWDDLLGELRARDAVTAEQIEAGAFSWVGQVVDVQGQAPVQLGRGGYAIGRRAMRDVLLARARSLGVDVRFEHPVDDVSQLTGHDLLVACDGVNSSVRRPYAGDLGTAVEHGANKYLWLGTDRVFSAFTFPFIRTPAGWIWAHAYAYDASTSTFIVETTPEVWRGLGFDQLGTDATMRRLEELFGNYLQGHALRPQPGTGDTLTWLEFRRVTNERWHTGNVVLMGDAAHTTHFTIGSGTRLALEDAIALADALHAHDTLEPALAAYGQRRATELRRAQRHARNSALWFEQIPRYANHDGGRFADLLDHRYSTFQRRLGPSAYLHLIDAADRMPALADPARHIIHRWRKRSESTPRRPG